MQALRYWDYYGMTGTFTDLYERAAKRETFSRLYEIIISRENILLAYRTIKSNKGSNTPGTDGRTIDNIKHMSDEELVTIIQHKLINYRPKKVRRKWIEKENGKWRPLGIPCILDRIIQQCFKQVMEPIAEAHFYKHSYGFRPLRSAHHALARVQTLINQTDLHFVVDIDILGFFDNVNHTLLIKQLWNLGIQDRRVLACISKMLKAEIEGEGIPAKGCPQGGILSPLLSNVVLNDLDQWVAGQWETFESVFPYSINYHKTHALKTSSKLKEGYIVRYADDFKILCRDRASAEKWFHAVRLYLKDRLKLDISPEKSQVVNLRKKKSEFLGFTIRADKKGAGRVAHTGIKEKKKKKIRSEAKQYIKRLKKWPTTAHALQYNSFVLGVHNYFNRATHVNIEFSILAYGLRAFMYNRLKRIGKYEYPDNPSPLYTKFYNVNFRTFKIAKVYLFPLADVKMVRNMNFSQSLTPFTEEGRANIYKKLRPDVQWEIAELMKSNLPNRSVEYMDNRVSRYSMKNGKCEITGLFLSAADLHCHHYTPVHLGGSDSFTNLRILHRDVHQLIHATRHETIVLLMTQLGLTEEMVKTINRYRAKGEREAVEHIPYP